jgi:uncharacterized membrane protein
MDKTSIGLSENVVGLLCYVLGWVSGIVFLLLEQENKFVKFHAIQSIIIFGALSVVNGVLGWIPVLGLIVGIISGTLAFVLWILLMVKASQGERYKVRWAGNYAERWAG